MWRSQLLALLLASVALAAPNIVVLFVDDLGYGDLSSYGHPTILTPNIDALAQSGIKFTNWYSAAAVCSPSRAALLTGRYPVRSGMAGGSWTGGVISASATGGLPANETTIATLLSRGAGYRTMAVGKWHLGQKTEFLPRQRGFDAYYGIPFSNDMAPSAWRPSPATLGGCSALPLLANETIIEQPVNLGDVTQRYTDEAIRFMTQSAGQARPFFLYLAYNHVHTPNFCTKDICGSSARGAFGDAVLEVDASVGRIVKALENLNLREETIVFFTSDNGPWLLQRDEGGSAGLLRDGKATAWEGGFRVPGIVSWPNTIAPNQVSSSIVNTMDIFTTSLALAGVPVPVDRPIDGKDLSDLLLGRSNDSPWADQPFFFYKGTPDPVDPVNRPGIWAARQGPYKLHWVTVEAFRPVPVFQDPPLLYNLEVDPSEQYPLNNAQYVDVIASLTAARQRHEASVTPVANQDGSDRSLCLCCDPNSQERYPDLPQCTCNPEYWTIPAQRVH